MIWKRFKNLFRKIRGTDYTVLDRAIDDALKGGVWDMEELARTLAYPSVFEMWKQIENEDVADNVRVRCNELDRHLIVTHIRQRVFQQQPVTWIPTLIDRDHPTVFTNLSALISHVESSFITFVMASSHEPKLAVDYYSLRPLVVTMTVLDTQTLQRIALGNIQGLTHEQAGELVSKYNG
ncbi:hypothetical protein pEaSNUABM29_00038 [Erwinia phage pEa_SNUABM_29]|nr:hypothetical protein pEaSNUABM29_00038 [Erwinia phage pEa_SNUABM_29]